MEKAAYLPEFKPPKGSNHGQVLVVIIACVPALVYGLMVGWVSSVIQLLQSADTPSTKPLSDIQISLMASVVSLSAAAATPFFIYSIDGFGRKPTIMLLSLLFAISWLLKLISAEAVYLITARAIAGFSAGGLFLALPIYINEVTHDSIRGASGVLLMISCNMGIIIVYGLGIILSYHQCLITYMAIPLLHLVVLFFVPETPVYCVRKKRFDEAAKNFAWLRNIDVADSEVVNEIEKLKKDHILFQKMPRVSIISIWKNKPVFRITCTVIIIFIVQPMSGNFAIINYATNIFARANTVWRPEYLGLFVGAMQLAGTIVSVNTIEKFGRKPLLVSSILSTGLSAGTLATWFLLSGDGFSVPDWIPVSAICISIFGHGLGLCGLPDIIMVDMLRFEHRARICGLASVISWIVSFLTVLTFMPIANALGESICFYIFCASALFGVVFVIIVLPETKGKNIEEIENEFLRKSERKI